MAQPAPARPKINTEVTQPAPGGVSRRLTSHGKTGRPAKATARVRGRPARRSGVPGCPARSPPPPSRITGMRGSGRGPAIRLQGPALARTVPGVRVSGRRRGRTARKLRRQARRATCGTTYSAGPHHPRQSPRGNCRRCGRADGAALPGPPWMRWRCPAARSCCRRGRSRRACWPGAGRRASTVTGLQMEPGEGPPPGRASPGFRGAFLPDLAAARPSRRPAFAAAALAVGVHAEFSLPLTAGTGCNAGTLDRAGDSQGC